MPQIAMTETERTQGLLRLGYTEPEARFLCLAALHGGYFLRRQFSEFAGKAATGASKALIEKLLDFEHATVSTFLHNTHVYHLSARRLYSAIGQEDNRNRREKEALTIKNKLMGLDFVLSHPSCQFLATEDEKVQFFSYDRGVDLSKLPAKRYASTSGGGSTVRYFVDKYPIFRPLRAGDNLTPPLVTFCFVDEGLTTASHFETYLGQYEQLFAALGAFHVTYVSTGSQPPPWAERTFERFVTRIALSAGRASQDTPRGLATHFSMRRAYESKNFAAFDRAKLLRYRQDRSRYSGQHIDEQFEVWKQSGLLPRGFEHVDESPAAGPLQAGFSAHLLANYYGFFGSINRDERLPFRPVGSAQ